MKGGSPSLQKDITTTSGLQHLTTQIVGTTHEVLAYGDCTDDCFALIENTHATAVVEVGVVVAATFYPLFEIPAGEEAQIPRLSSLAGTYLKSSVASTEVSILLAKIAA